MTLRKRSGPTVLQWVLSAAKTHREWPGHWRKGYAGMLEVGFKLIRAKEKCTDLEGAGSLIEKTSAEFETALRMGAPEVRKTMAIAYMELAQDALTWTQTMHPQITDRSKQEAVASTVMILSPKKFVALMRCVGEMRPFGQYDAIKYREQKRLGSGEQLELRFDKLMATFDVFDVAGEVVLKMPEGKDEEEGWAQIVERCERLAEIGRVKMRKAIDA